MEILSNLRYDWDHNKIITVAFPRLYQLGAVKTALNLWLAETEIDEIFPTLRKVEDKIPLLNVSRKVAENVSIKVELIGEQLSEFKELLPDKFPMLNNWSTIKNKIHWTAQATIDKIRTAETLADADDINLKIRFLIAVDFNLKDRVNKLCVRMSRFARREFDIEHRFLVGSFPVAVKHFDIQAIDFNYNRCLTCMCMNERNEICYLYYWHHFIGEGKLLDLETFYRRNWSKLLLYVFTHCDREGRLQLIQDERCCCLLLQELLNVQWFPIFDAFAKEVLKALKVDSLLKLLFTSASKIESTVFYRSKYVEICSRLFSSICKESLENFRSSDKQIVIVLFTLMKEGKTKLIKDFLESMGNDWIKDALKSCTFMTNDLPKYCMILLKCGIFENVISSFSTKERKKLVKYDNDIIFKLFALGNQADDVDIIASALFSGSEEVQNYKRGFCDDIGFGLCRALLSLGKWKSAMNLVQWYLSSEEQIICFYHNFFKSNGFSRLFNTVEVKKSSKAIVSLISAIRENACLERHFNIELIFDVLLVILFGQHCIFIDRQRKLNESKALFDAFDAILLPFFDDQKKLTDFKKDALTDKKKLMYLSFPQESLKKMMEGCEFTEKCAKRVDELWHEMTEDFFTWMCSSDKQLKSELKEELMKSEAIKESLERLREARKRPLKGGHRPFKRQKC